MATAAQKRKAAAAKAAPEVEPEVVETEGTTEDGVDETREAAGDETVEDLDELEELDEAADADEPAAKPAGKGGKKAAKEKAAKAPKVEFGSRELAAHVSEQTGKTYDPKALRVLLRKLAADGKLQRETTEGGGRARYSFSGPDDPQVKAIVQAVKDGEAEKAKAAQIDKAKAAAEKSGKGKKAKDADAAAAEVEEADDDADTVDDDLEDLDDE